MKKSVLLLCGIIVAAATLGAANEALKPGPVQPVDIESRIPAPQLHEQHNRLFTSPEQTTEQ